MINFLHNLGTDFMFVFQRFALNLCSVLVPLWQLFRNEMNLNFRTCAILRSIYFLINSFISFLKTALKSNRSLFKKHNFAGNLFHSINSLRRMHCSSHDLWIMATKFSLWMYWNKLSLRINTHICEQPHNICFIKWTMCVNDLANTKAHIRMLPAAENITRWMNSVIMNNKLERIC
jgi:hypothetical protein